MGLAATRYLKEMGIDVWVRRGRARSVTSAPAQEATAPPQPAPGGNERRAAPPPQVKPETAPTFHLCFMTYGDLSLVISVPHDATTLPASMRRFADDMALALSLEPNPVVTALRWPMVQSEHIDQSPAAAAAVIEQRLAGCGPSLLLFGRDVERLVGELATDRRCLVVDDLSAYLREPLEKRDLWKTLEAFRGVGR